MRVLVLCSLVLVLLSCSVSAVPFDVKVEVNGVDPTVGTAVVEPGKPAEVIVHVDAESDNVYVVGLEFESSPSVMADIVRDFVSDKVTLPYKLKESNQVETYNLPGVMPAGDYNLVVRVLYTGDENGVAEYNGRINVKSTGIISMILGFLIRILPDFISKPIVQLFI